MYGEPIPVNELPYEVVEMIAQHPSHLGLFVRRVHGYIPGRSLDECIVFFMLQDHSVAVLNYGMEDYYAEAGS